MSQITHKNLETGESVSANVAMPATEVFEYQNEVGDTVGISATCWMEFASSDDFALVDPVAYRVALADALNRSNLDFADRQEFHHKLLDQSAD